MAHEQPTADKEHTQETEEVRFCSVDTYTHPQPPRMIMPTPRRSSSFKSQSSLHSPCLANAYVIDRPADA